MDIIISVQDMCIGALEYKHKRTHNPTANAYVQITKFPQLIYLPASTSISSFLWITANIIWFAWAMCKQSKEVFWHNFRRVLPLDFTPPPPKKKTQQQHLFYKQVIYLFNYTIDIPRFPYFAGNLMAVSWCGVHPFGSRQGINGASQILARVVDTHAELSHLRKTKI